MTISFLIIEALVIAVLAYLLINRKKPFAIAGTSTVADAIVLNIQLTGVCIRNEIQAIIQLQVLPEKGKSFVTDVKELLSATEYSSLQPGKKILVNFNQRKQKELCIIKESISQIFRSNKTNEHPMVK
ncbi:MAG: hypothetical protein JST81_06645 [Bacteroidetes bacterium]|nr:hypothetical protein [Bacteroidota bacterium]